MYGSYSRHLKTTCIKLCYSPWSHNDAGQRVRESANNSKETKLCNAFHATTSCENTVGKKIVLVVVYSEYRQTY